MTPTVTLDNLQTADDALGCMLDLVKSNSPRSRPGWLGEWLMLPHPALDWMEPNRYMTTPERRLQVYNLLSTMVSEARP